MCYVCSRDLVFDSIPLRIIPLQAVAGPEGMKDLDLYKSSGRATTFEMQILSSLQR